MVYYSSRGRSTELSQVTSVLHVLAQTLPQRRPLILQNCVKLHIIAWCQNTFGRAGLFKILLNREFPTTRQPALAGHPLLRVHLCHGAAGLPGVRLKAHGTGPGLAADLLLRLRGGGGGVSPSSICIICLLIRNPELQIFSVALPLHLPAGPPLLQHKADRVSFKGRALGLCDTRGTP